MSRLCSCKNLAPLSSKIPSIPRKPLGSDDDHSEVSSFARHNNTQILRSRSGTEAGPSPHRHRYPHEAFPSCNDRDHNLPSSEGGYTVCISARVTEATGGSPKTTAASGSATVRSSHAETSQRKRSADVGDETSTEKRLAQLGKKAKQDRRSPRTHRSKRYRLYVLVYEADPLTSLYCCWSLFLQSPNGRGYLHDLTGNSQPLLYWVRTTYDAIPEDMGQIQDEILVGNIDDIDAYDQTVRDTTIFNNDSHFWVFSALGKLAERKILGESDHNAAQERLGSHYYQPFHLTH